MQSCQFLDEESTKLTMSGRGDNCIVELAKDEYLQAFLLPLRKMFSDGEPTNFRRIHNFILKYAPHDLAKQHAIELRQRIDQELSGWFPSPVKPHPTSPYDLVKSFFNGHYFHGKETIKSKPCRDQIQSWYNQLGEAETNWVFQSKLHNLGIYFIQHAYSAVAAARYAVRISNIQRGDFLVSDECAKLIGLEVNQSTIMRKSQYQDIFSYQERYRRTLSLNQFKQLSDFLEAANFANKVATVAPEHPLTIESLLRELNIKWRVVSEMNNENFKQLGSVLLTNFTRSSGIWAKLQDNSFVFSGDALLLLDIALAESRSVAASPRSLSQKIFHLRNTLAVCDRWFWEEKIVDGKSTYQQYGTADFSKLGVEG